MTATLKNNQSGPLSLSSIAVDGSAAADFAASSDCPLNPGTLASGESCKVSVTFTPTASGLRTATLKVNESAQSSFGIVALRGTGLPSAEPALDLANSGGSVMPAKSSVLVTTSQNEIQESHAGSLRQVTGRGRPLPATSSPGNGFAPLNVTSPQTPALGDGLTGILITPANSTILAGTTQQFSATGYYADGSIVNLTMAVAWASSAPGVAVISNTGLATSISGGSATITATFSTAVPLGSIEGGIPGSPIVSAPNAPVSASTALGVIGIVSLSTGSMSFAGQSVGTASAARAVTLTNLMGSNLVFSSVQLAGANSGDFGISSNTCTSPLPVMSSCSVSVTFTPTTPLGRSASLIFTDSGGNSPGAQQTVVLSGMGIGPLAGISPANGTNFGSQQVSTNNGSQPITLSNLGNEPLAIANFGITGGNAEDFVISSTTCLSSLAASASCAFYVSFTPTAPFGRAASLVVTDNSGNVPNSQQSVVLSGTGLGPIAAVTPASPSGLNFNSQTVGVTSPMLTASLSNSGNAPLLVDSVAITGANAGDFSLLLDDCTGGVAASSSCATYVTFTPQGSGSRTATLTFGDNANPSQQSITLTGTGVVVNGTASVTTTPLTFTALALNDSTIPQAVTVSNTGKGPLFIAGIAVTLGSSVFSQYNDCAPTLYSGTSCTVYVTYAPTTGGSSSGTLTITDNTGGVSGSQQTVSLTGLTNAVEVDINLGPNDNRPNGIYTTVTVCEPGTTLCASIPDILVDTGTTGLRVLASQLEGLTLPSISNASAESLYECAEFGSLNYTWGPVELATIQITGETASQAPAADGGTANSGVPIQVILDGQEAPANTPCATGGGVAQNSVATLNANGILGVGNAPQDCAVAGANECATEEGIDEVSPYPYVYCNTTTCEATSVPLQYQVWNPVAAFSSSDTNGVVIELPEVALSGAPTLYGTLTFGNNTQPNNAIPSSATTYELDGQGQFPTIVFSGVDYFDAGLVDSGSNAYFVSDAATLTSATGITTTICGDNTFYCPTSPLGLNLALNGFNGTFGNATLYIDNADSLLSNCAGCVAFDSLAAPSGTSPSNDFWDLGLPFFLGRQIFVGIAGSTTYPNGYWAF